VSSWSLNTAAPKHVNIIYTQWKYEFWKEDNQLIEDHSEVTPDFLAILTSMNFISSRAVFAHLCTICLFRKDWWRMHALSYKNCTTIMLRFDSSTTGQVNLEMLNVSPTSALNSHPHTQAGLFIVYNFLCLAYVMTFNGWQGLTLDKTVLDLGCKVFAHGQIYTALSWICQWDDSCILFLEDKLNDDFNASNIVYKE
jgi:hypothetical protein